MEQITPSQEPLVIPRAEHIISRANISPNALKVLYRLRDAGFRACLVGGGVRDLLLGREPKDFDIGTDAHPEQVYKLFRNCRLIGRRFRLAHVHFGQEIIEVATFRAQQSDDEDDNDSSDTEVQLQNGRIVSDNVYGTIENDAERRDFTVNALYYDIETFAVLDYTTGIEDLEAGILRMIGDAEVRYREDPVRMLRAVRFAAKLGFRLHPATEAPIHRLAHLLRGVPPARLFDEVLKLLLSGYAIQTYELLRLYGLFGHLFPVTEQRLRSQRKGFPRTLLTHALTNTDERIQEGKPVTPAFLYAALLWEPLRAQVEQLTAAGMDDAQAIYEAADTVIEQQVKHIALPRRYSQPMREIWELQPRLAHPNHKRAQRLLGHPRLRAAYDFLLLRAAAGDEVGELAAWWSEFFAQSPLPQEQSEPPVQQDRPPRKRRRRPTDVRERNS